MVTFINHTKCVFDGDLGVIDNCGRTLAHVRRMAQRFPSIDSEDAWVTLVQNLVATLLKALRSQDRRPYVENR